MNFIRRLNRGNVNLSRQDFTCCNLLGLGWLEVGNKCKNSAQNLQNYNC